MGDSMMPKLKPGDIIMYKEMPLNLQDLFYGEMYLISYEIDGDYYVVVKYIRKSEKGEPFITLASENPEHASKDIEFGRINALALIKRIYKCKFYGITKAFALFFERCLAPTKYAL